MQDLLVDLCSPHKVLRRFVEFRDIRLQGQLAVLTAKDDESW